MNNNLASHNLVESNFKEIIYDLHPCLDNNGKEIDGLNNAWILLNNPEQYNSYTTAAVKEIILAFRAASNAQVSDWYPVQIAIPAPQSNSLKGRKVQCYPCTRVDYWSCCTFR